MAFALSGLKASGYYAGPNMEYSYNTADSLATVAGANYFNNAAKYLRLYDRINVSGGQGGTAASKWYTVTGHTGTVITVTKDDLT